MREKCIGKTWEEMCRNITAVDLCARSGWVRFEVEQKGYFRRLGSRKMGEELPGGCLNRGVWKHWLGLAGGEVRSCTQGQDGSRALISTLGDDRDLEQAKTGAYKGEKKLECGEEYYKEVVSLKQYFCSFLLRFRFRTRRWTSPRSPPSAGPRPTSSTSLVSVSPSTTWVLPSMSLLFHKNSRATPTQDRAVEQHSPQSLSGSRSQGAELSVGGGADGKGHHLHGPHPKDRLCACCCCLRPMGEACPRGSH